MATGATQPSPAELEQTYLAALEQENRVYLANMASLAALEQQNRMLLANMASVFPFYWPASSLESEWAAYSTNQWETHLRSYGPMAQYLLAAGLPRLSERLRALLEDVQRAKAMGLQAFQGLIATNPIFQGPIATNPIFQGPIATNPIFQGPIATNPGIDRDILQIYAKARDDINATLGRMNDYTRRAYERVNRAWGSYLQG